MDYSKRKERANSFLNKLNLKSKSKTAFWEVLDDMLTFLYQNYPTEIIQHEIECKQIREASINKFHGNVDNSERIMGAYPIRFYSMIMAYTDKFTEMPYKTMYDFHGAFFKRYKQFSYAERI